jgi:uncharacterized protein (TIGR04222 family)
MHADPVEGGWTEQLNALWRRLREHPFEDSRLKLDFARRLAREQGWSLGVARAAIEEYRRFCFLAVAAGHPVTPSADVDEVWHLHLVHSRDYWQHFCPQVLGCDLHHGPTGGSRQDYARYREQYGATLRAYEHFFGAPPERWWPARNTRFSGVGRFRRIDTARHWIIGKPRLPGVPQRIALALGLGLLTLPMLAAALPDNPLDWPAGPFLALFASLSVASIVVTCIVRWRSRETASPVLMPEPSVWELAYLAGGPDRVADAAVTDLLAKQVVAWDASSGRLQPTGVNAELDAPSSETLRCLKADSRLKVAFTRIRRAQAPLREALVRRRLWLDQASARRVAWMSALAPLAVFSFGAARIYLAIARERPYLCLLVMTTVIGLIGLAYAVSTPGRTRAGDRYLAQAKQRHSVTRRAPQNDELALAVALGGTAVLADTMFADYHRSRVPPGDSGSSGDDSSSSSDSSDGGGSSGCGGCGGGD